MPHTLRTLTAAFNTLGCACSVNWNRVCLRLLIVAMTTHLHFRGDLRLWVVTHEKKSTSLCSLNSKLARILSKNGSIYRKQIDLENVCRHAHTVM